MKKDFLNKMFMAVAMIFAAGMFAACSSSSDDDNSKKETPATPVATSGTLYMYEVVLPEATNWADCGFSWTKSGAVTKITTSVNATTLDKLTNAKLVADIKETIQKAGKIEVPDGKSLDDKAIVIVDSVSLKDGFSSDINFTFALKSDFEDKGEEQDFTYGSRVCFIDNLGKVQSGGINSVAIAGVSNLSEYLKVMQEETKVLSVSVTKKTDGFSLNVDEKK